MGGFISAADEERLTITPPFFSRNLGSRIFVIYMRVGEWKKRENRERETQKERGSERKEMTEGEGERESLRIQLDCDSM
jgi:hypothetical protein